MIEGLLKRILDKLNATIIVVQDSISRTVTGTVTVVPSGDMARKEYYDRNPDLQIKFFTGTAGAHAWTVRWTYTVPSNHKAIHSVMYQRVGTAVATATKTAHVEHEGRVSGGTFYKFGSTVHSDGDGLLSILTVTATFALSVGDGVRGRTYNNDTVSHTFQVSSLLTEFDE